MENQIRVKDIMTKEVVSITPETPVHDIARLLYKHNISGVPVVENGKVVGIVTEEDIIMRDAIITTPHVFNLFDSVFFLGNRKEFEKELTHALATHARELMTGKVVTIQESATVQELATLIMKREVNPVPVTDAKGELLGVVSRADIIRLMALDQDTEPLGDEDETPVTSQE
jgi:CBS domain-containing protein